MQTTYTEILAEISNQISSRKKILIQRTLLTTWPFILCFIVAFGYAQITGKGLDTLIASSVTNMVITGAVFFLVFWYTIIMSSILKIEKMIWIDSFFDKKNLTTKESFTISKRLFWPFFKLSTVIFLRFYLVIILAIPVAIFAGVAISGLLPPSTNEFVVFLLLYLFILVGFIAWIYYTRIKLRYVRFVFLDSYKGGSMNVSSVIATTKQLNQIFKSESFKKALFSQLGVDSAQAIAGMVTNSFTSMLAQGGARLGGLGGESVKAVAGIANMYANEYAKQIADLSRVVSMYVLYREALKQLTGSEQVENEYIYNLK